MSSEVRVKVNMDSKEHSAVMYKKMSINDKYRTKDVKRLILEKFFLNPDSADKYTLVQILGSGPGGGELVINDNCNVFYAAKRLPEMQFVLRSKIGETLSTSLSSSASANENASNGGFYANSNLQHQAKFTRHSFANINHTSTGGYSHQSQSQSKPSKWWLKKILT
jgi:hypothetical protein